MRESLQVLVLEYKMSVMMKGTMTKKRMLMRHNTCLPMMILNSR